MGVSYSPKIVTDGLVLALDAANVKSYPGTGTAWTDLSNNGNNGTLVNGPTFDSDNLGSLVFDGTNSYVQKNTTITTNIMTISSWIRPTMLASQQHGSGIFSYGSGSTNSGIFEILLTLSDGNFASRGDGNNRFLFRMLSSENSGILGISLSSTTNLLLNTIYQVTAVYDESSMKIYINGTLDVNSNVSFQTLITNGSLYRIGMRHNSTSGPFGGNIYSTAVYNRALTPQEILQNYNATKGRFGL